MIDTNDIDDFKNSFVNSDTNNIDNVEDGNR